MKKVKELLCLPLEFRVSVFVRMVQHTQPAVGSFQLFLSGLGEEKKSNYSIINALSHYHLPNLPRNGNPSDALHCILLDSTGSIMKLCLVGLLSGLALQQHQ